MPRKPAKDTTRYNGGLIRQRRDCASIQAEYRLHGRRYRRSFDDDADARAWIDTMAIDAANSRRPMEVADYRDARDALEMLPPDVSLCDAARAYLRQHQTIEDISVPDAVEAYMRAKRAAGLRDKTLEAYRYQLHAMESAFAGRNVSDIQGRDIAAWLDSGGWAGRTRAGYRRAVSAFFQWASRMGYHDGDNPAQAVTASITDDTMPGVLTVDQAAQLLATATREDARFVPYIAIGLFAGVRPTEITRLTWGDVDEDMIRVPGAAGKVRHTRHVTMPENLRAWLAPYRRVAGHPIMEITSNWRAVRFKELRVAAGITDWPHDAMRHSYASYHLALYRDAALTAHELGHRRVHVLYNHYRAIVTHDDATRYFDIQPHPESHGNGHDVS